MQRRETTGSAGESLAANWLERHGFIIRERNYARKHGEIDIVAAKDRVLHFIEVKTSRFYPDTSFTPEIRINRRKIRNLKRICETYLRETHVSQDQKWQIDVISVILCRDGAVKELNYIENAVFEERY